MFRSFLFSSLAPVLSIIRQTYEKALTSDPAMLVVFVDELMALIYVDTNRKTSTARSSRIYIH